MNTDLTNKEQKIFDLNTLALTRQEICKKLNITKSTLQTHLNNIAAKFAMPEKMNIQYFMACVKLEQLEKRQMELEKLLNEISNK